MSVNLSEKAMLVSLSISCWTARRLDKKVTKEVQDLHQVAAGFGHYNKRLVAQEAIQRIQQIDSALRSFHYENTMPWSDNGDRMLPATNYLKYTSKVREFVALREKAVEDFVAAYPGLIVDARASLNGLFNQDDYPDPVMIRGKFSVNVDVNPLQVANDFRVTLQGDEIKTIKDSIEQRSQEKLEIATRDLWQRLYEAVQHMAVTLREPKKIFKNTLVGNVQELADLLPRLNVTGDPKLDELCKQAKASLSVDPEVLREKPDARQAAANRAADILNAMSGYCGKGGC